MIFSDQRNTTNEATITRTLTDPSTTETQEEECVKERREKANQNDIESQYFLGLWYEMGICGLPASFSEAVKWYQLAAEAGNANAQFQLGSCYRYGNGVQKN